MSETGWSRRLPARGYARSRTASARVKAVEDAAIARAAEAASAEVKAREEAKRRSYENRRAVGLALLAFLLGLMATWAKARAGW